MRQNILEHQAGVHVAVAIFPLQPVQQFAERPGIIADFHALLIGGQDRVALPPYLGPIHLFLRFLADAVDRALDFLHLRVKGNQVIQRQAVEPRQPLGLADVGQAFVCFP